MFENSNENALFLDFDKIQLASVDGKIVISTENEGLTQFYDGTGNEIIEEPYKPDRFSNVSLYDLLDNEIAGNIVEKLVEHLKEYIFLSNETEYVLLAIYIILSYCYNIFDRIPYIHLSGAYGSGKTRILSVLRPLLFNAKMYSHASPAAIFRVIDEEKCVLILDELENIGTRTSSNNPIIQLLNSGYQKDGKVVRVSKFNPVSFKTYCPKLIASKNSLHPSTADRCIMVQMNKSPISLKSYSDSDTSKIVKQIRLSILQSLYQKRETLSEVVKDVTPDSVNLNNRDFDRWHSILALAKMFCSDNHNYYEEILHFALEELETKREYERTLPHNMAREIIKDVISAGSMKSMIPDKDYFYFRADQIQKIITDHDQYNFYRNKAEITIILQELGIRTDRRRFGAGPITLYKVPKNI